jgi:hypothetical protein
MDGFLGIIGILALAFGALLVGAGIVDAEPANTYFGASLVGSGVGFLAISTVINPHSSRSAPRGAFTNSAPPRSGSRI